MYEVERSNSFKKDFKLIKKRGYDIEKLKEIIIKLQRGEKLPLKNKDHNLTGKWSKHRECHISPDWLLIYRINDNILELVKTGTHSDLF